MSFATSVAGIAHSEVLSVRLVSRCVRRVDRGAPSDSKSHDYPRDGGTVCMLVMLMTCSHSCTRSYMDIMGICYDWEIQFLECAQNIPTSDEPTDTGSTVPPMPTSPFIN